MKRDPHVRYPLVEGLFYPSDQEKLREKTDSLLQGERSDSPALILPHASFDMVGEICGRAWMKSADRPVSHILILAPVHREPEPLAILPPYERFASPLGERRVDREILERLAAGSALFREDVMPYEEEHAPELCLPFMTRLFPEAKILPIHLGNLRRKEIKALGKVLREELAPLKEGLLTLICSNLSRFITPPVSRREAEYFLRYLKEESLTEQEKKEISACGTVGLDLFREIDLYRGGFRELDRFEEEGRENRKPASLHYGTFFFDQISR
ncbi:MAG: AmmeMemoRadiSam system protein B [Spirochaetales bacterium]|nr:AmmeMemoRadiSam system protein B [Spirochaetales bacterium]